MSPSITRMIISVAAAGPPIGLLMTGIVMGLLGRRVSRTLVVFVALGPPIGYLTFAVLSVPLELELASSAFGDFALPAGGDGSLLSLIFPGLALLISIYFLGVAPAAVSGSLVALVRSKGLQHEPVWVISIAALVGIAFSLVSTFLDELTLWNSAAKALTFIAFEVWIETSFWALTLACVVSILACWAILRRMAASVRFAPRSRENPSEAPNVRRAAREDVRSAGLMRAGSIRPSVMRTLVVFVVLGPAVGLLTFMGVIILFAVQHLSVKKIVSELPRFLGPGAFLMSYAVGALPAVLSGGLVAWLQSMPTRYELLWVAAIGLLVGIAYTYLGFLILEPLISKGFLLGLGLACLVSTLVCWAILRRLDKHQRISA